jgi:hypothetical protein
VAYKISAEVDSVMEITDRVVKAGGPVTPFSLRDLESNSVTENVAADVASKPL